jgi:demethylmenaquinone methyltransferase / 2-methoxy-6-polyprenyl-1,4-benzoquinol methylase
MSDGDRLSRSFGASQVSVDERRNLIRRTFQQVAPRYDLMNDLMSMGVHRFWKMSFIEQTGVKAGEVAIDLAGGTGDIALGLAALGAEVYVVDPSPEMMTMGRTRVGAETVGWVAAEAEHLPFADGCVDLVTISFGIRNATEVDVALREIHRILKPGGRFFCLEFSTPRPWLSPLYGLWSRTAIPVLGAAVSGKREAYRYLVESIRAFPNQQQFAGMINSSGFVDTRWRDFSFGIAAVHSARKPRG